MRICLMFRDFFYHTTILIVEVVLSNENKEIFFGENSYINFNYLLQMNIKFFNF